MRSFPLAAMLYRGSAVLLAIYVIGSGIGFAWRWIRAKGEPSSKSY
jgi:hypothetical protein